jgi:hypothetical protein
MQRVSKPNIYTMKTNTGWVKVHNHSKRRQNDTVLVLLQNVNVIAQSKSSVKIMARKTRNRGFAILKFCQVKLE